MSSTNIILAGRNRGLGWIRCEGKGSFMNSPRMKAWSDDMLKDDCTHIVVDLENCTGMDSTFMGTMAGIAMRLAKTSGGLLEVASAGEKNSRSLEDLGLSALMHINPPAPSWEGLATKIRADLEVCEKGGTPDRTQHVFDAHKKLCDADNSNNGKFSTVLDCLEAELKARDSRS